MICYVLEVCSILVMIYVVCAGDMLCAVCAGGVLCIVVCAGGATIKRIMFVSLTLDLRSSKHSPRTLEIREQ